MKKHAKRLLVALLAVSCLFGTCGCIDLGDFESDADYYASFGDICFVCPSETYFPTILEYPLADISNKESQGSNATVMPSDCYKYVAFQALDTMEIDDFCLWMITDQDFNGYVQAEIYLSNSLSTTYFPNFLQAPYAGCYEKRTTDGLTETVETITIDGYGEAGDKKGHTSAYTALRVGEGFLITFTLSYTDGETEKDVEYSCYTKEPYDSLSVQIDDSGNVSDSVYTFASLYEDEPEAGLTQLIGKDSVYAKKGEWCSLFIEEWIDGQSTPTSVTIEKDTYIYVKILNNCTGGSRKQLSPISFRANNLMIRAVKN